MRYALALAASLGLPLSGAALPIDFEAVEDLFGTGVVVDTQYAADGVLFSNALALTAGISLNEIELPPRSGLTVLFNADGALAIDFTIPVNFVEAYFTYYVPLTLQAFDATGGLLGEVTSAFSSNLGVDPTTGIGGDTGSTPNERLALLASSAIARVVIEGDPLGWSFAMDDLDARWVSIPEPSMLLLIVSGAAMMRLRRTR